MLIFEHQLPKKIDCFKLYDIFCKMARTINPYYIYQLFASGNNKIVLYSIEQTETGDINNCPCGLIYNIEKIEKNKNSNETENENENENGRRKS